MIGKQEISALLSRWKPIGYEIKGDGTELIGKVPHVAPEAWMHKIFAPNNSPEFNEKYQRMVPGFHKYSFTKVFDDFNGFILFSANLYMCGNRTSYRRDGTVFQPWELDNGIWEGHDAGLGEDVIAFGGSNALPDGIWFAETGRGKIVAIDRETPGVPMFAWPDFETFLASEIHRLSRLFDDKGRPLDRRALSAFGQ